MVTRSAEVGVAGGLAAGLFFERLRIASGMLLGALAWSAIRHATSVAPGQLPASLQISVQICVGLGWGRAVSASIGGCLVIRQALPLCSIADDLGKFAYATTVTLSIPFADTIVAFGPGAVEAMTVRAFALGLDPLYVGSHHLARFILISLAAPLTIVQPLLAGQRRQARSIMFQTDLNSADGAAP